MANSKPESKPSATTMNEASLNTLHRSQDPRELVTAAVKLARSQHPEDLKVLQDFLLSSGSLNRLDSEDDYENKPRERLRIGQILNELRLNPQTAAKDLLVRLSQSKLFIEHPDRADLLIMASASVRPPPPPLIAFWDAHCQPNDGFTPLTIDTLTENGCPQPIELLERKLADPSHSTDAKLDWMHRSIIPHRDDLELLRGCERMLSGSLPGPLRAPLVETIFDYKPDQWYPEHLIRTPPNRLAASPEQKTELRKLAEFALANVSLEPPLRAKVEVTLRGLKQETQK